MVNGASGLTATAGAISTFLVALGVTYRVVILPIRRLVDKIGGLVDDVRENTRAARELTNRVGSLEEAQNSLERAAVAGAATLVRGQAALADTVDTALSEARTEVGHQVADRAARTQPRGPT